MATQADDLRSTVATACRIIGTQVGLGGHASARIPGTDEMWVRCRGGRSEDGLALTDLHHIRRVDFDGEGPGLGTKHAVPNETPLHGEIYRARPDVNAVVHAHPKYALFCGATGIEFTPFFGGYDPSLLRIALLGVPVYPRAATVTTKEMAIEMVRVMGERDIVLLRGHGIAAVGPSVEAATRMAVRFERLCELMWEVAAPGRKIIEISDEDKARYDPRRRAPSTSPPTRGRAGLRALRGESEEGDTGWRRYLEHLEATVGLPDPTLDE